MSDFSTQKSELENNGFSITEPIFDTHEIEHLISLIEKNDSSYSIRQLVNKIPEIKNVIFNNQIFRSLFNAICDNTYFLSKAIYFNKQSQSNWFVGYHQDLSISVKEQIENKNFRNWTNKQGQLGVIPPLNIIENTCTFRLHLDKTEYTNGALTVIPNSHNKGIIKIDEHFSKSKYNDEVICDVEKGGVMLMKPLLLHSSNKSISNSNRRVIHLEFCNIDIPMGWLEKKAVS